MTVKKQKIMMWVVDRLPKVIVYLCFIKVVALATTGKYSNTVVPEITAMEALKRYGEDNAEDIL